MKQANLKKEEIKSNASNCVCLLYCFKHTLTVWLLYLALEHIGHLSIRARLQQQKNDYSDLYVAPCLD